MWHISANWAEFPHADFYATRYFGFKATATKALDTVIGYDPTVAHWGWNGNARRYWDFL